MTAAHRPPAARTVRSGALALLCCSRQCRPRGWAASWARRRRAASRSTPWAPAPRKSRSRRLGEDGNEVPASALPCASCHGLDGHGGKEGGLRPSDLTPEALGRPAHGEIGGRSHPPYDDRLLVRAITMGLDPAGNRLHVAMPRYRLTQKDAADLLAYLKRLGSEGRAPS